MSPLAARPGWGEMAEGFLEMSSDERERSHLVRQHVEGGLGQREAAERLGIGVRQFKRLVRSWREDGDAGLVSRRRGRPSNHRLSDLRRAEIAALLTSRYSGFGYLPEFILEWNKKFAVEPRDRTPAHRPWTKSAEDLDLALARQEGRVLSKALTFSYGGTKYCVKTQGPGTAMRGVKIAVHQFIDGRLRFSYKDRVLSCTAYGTYAVPDPAADEKTLDARVDAIADARGRAARQVTTLAA